MHLIVYSSIICNSQTGKAPQCPSTAERLHEWWYIYTVECHSAPSLPAPSGVHLTMLGKEARHKSIILHTSMHRKLINRQMKLVFRGVYLTGKIFLNPPK